MHLHVAMPTGCARPLGVGPGVGLLLRPGQAGRPQRRGDQGGLAEQPRESLAIGVEAKTVSPRRIPVSYTHLTLPTTPYV